MSRKSGMFLLVIIPLILLIGLVAISKVQSRDAAVSNPANVRNVSLTKYLKNFPEDVQKNCKKVTVHYDVPSDIAKQLDRKDQTKILKNMISDGMFGKVPTMKPELPKGAMSEDDCTPMICCMTIDDEPEECWPCCAD